MAWDEPICALCGCTEAEHFGKGITEDGEESEEICTGCGAECPFEESEEDEDGEAPSEQG